MKADRRWWNDGRYDLECAKQVDVLWRPLDQIRAITDSGLEIWVKLEIRFPMHVGVAYL